MSNNEIDMKSYLQDSKRTAIEFDNLSVDRYTYAKLNELMSNMIRFGHELDNVKKHVFYGKDYPQNMVDGYQEGLEDTKYYSFDSFGADLLHGIIGKTTESVECLEVLQTYVKSDAKELDKINLEEEIGDGFWYDAMVLRLLGSSFEESANKNINKLKVRFPEKFDAERAINRNYDLERKEF